MRIETGCRGMKSNEPTSGEKQEGREKKNSGRTGIPSSHPMYNPLDCGEN